MSESETALRKLAVEFENDLHTDRQISDAFHIVANNFSECDRTDGRRSQFLFNFQDTSHVLAGQIIGACKDKKITTDLIRELRLLSDEYYHRYSG